jgi:hypothetical protein
VYGGGICRAATSAALGGTARQECSQAVSTKMVPAGFGFYKAKQTPKGVIDGWKSRILVL